MFGLGRKKIQAPPEEQGPSNKADTIRLRQARTEREVSAAILPEERLMVMPEKYRPTPITSKHSVLKWVIVSVVVVLVLGGAGAAVYFVFLQEPGPADLGTTQDPLTNAPTNNTEIPNPEETGTTTAPELGLLTGAKIEATSQDAAGSVIGTITLSIPESVAETSSATIGVTVLSSADVELPEGVKTYGGVYSLYPIGVSFVEPITIEIDVVNTPLVDDEVVPAFLRGLRWQPVLDHTLTLTGWRFTLDKFPSGPLAIVDKFSSGPDGEEVPIDSVTIEITTDTDSDGVTDKEEELFGSDVSALDSDGDEYSDKIEIVNGYHPAGVGQTLESSGIVREYLNPTYGYKVQHPANWLADSLDQSNKQVLFISDTEEFFEILVEENPLGTPIVDWYRSQSPQLATVPLAVAVVDGASAVWSPDHLTLYVGKNGLVYIITYNKGTLAAINWPTVFERFYKSFKFGNTSS